MCSLGKTTARLLSIVTLLACLALTAVAQQEISITIARIKGQVEVHNKLANAGWVAAKTEQTITTGWELRTGADSKVQLVFPLDNIVILKENSVLYVDQLDPGGGATLTADEGDLLVDIRNALAAGSEFQLQTPTALAVVRGTKYGAANIDQYDSTFYGYEGDTSIYTLQAGVISNEIHLLKDETTEVWYGKPPTGPDPSPSAADDFLADAEDTSGFEAVEDHAAAYARQLQSIMRDSDDWLETLTQWREEWRRYEHNDQVSHIVFLYAQVLAIGRQVERGQQDFDDLSSEIAGAGDDVANTAPLPQLLLDVAARFRELNEMLEDFGQDAEPFIEGDQELLDTLDGLIPPGNPKLGLRWGLIDTDNDGISDLDEWSLGLDPLVANTDGFITLVAPDDGEEIIFPEQTEATFEFQKLDNLKVEDIVRGYNLVLEADGRQLARHDIDETEDVDLYSLVGPGGVFENEVDADGILTLTWYVQAEINEDQLFQQITAEQPGFRSGFGDTIASEQRTLRIQVPTQVDRIIVDLEPVGPNSVSVDQTVVIRGVISEVNSLGRWEIEVVYDSSVLDFDRGRRLGMFTGSTVFFGDQPGGVVVISGVSPRGSDGLSGDGDIFELEFRAIAEGQSTVEVDNVELHDILDTQLDAEGGDDVEVSVFPVGQTPSGLPNRRTGNFR